MTRVIRTPHLVWSNDTEEVWLRHNPLVYLGQLECMAVGLPPGIQLEWLRIRDRVEMDLMEANHE